MAGQFAKPRSEDTETINGVTLPSYRGDNINSSEFTEEARRPDPSRLLRAYDQSCSTLNLLRAFSNGGYASMQRVSKWNLDFMEDTERGTEYRELASRVDAAINFMKACGIDEDTPPMESTDFFTAHEALHLGYEETLTRLDSTTEEFYGCSAHFLWCGERTRQPEGAHMEYFRGISNPIGIKISDKSDGPSVVSLVKTLNPENVPGRITLISRMGAEKLREHLPRLIEAVDRRGPQRALGYGPDARKHHQDGQRLQDPSVRARARRDHGVLRGARADGDAPGRRAPRDDGSGRHGVHGRHRGGDHRRPGARYLTHCDPRLNASQALELAFLMSSKLAGMRSRGAVGAR